VPKPRLRIFSGSQLLTLDPGLFKRKPWDSNPQVAHATGCFQDSVLIRPDDFRCKLRGLESNQRPPGSEPGVTTSSNCPGSFCFNNDTSMLFGFAKLGEKESNLHLLLQRQAAYR
jgi:hypothetical protein